MPDKVPAEGLPCVLSKVSGGKSVRTDEVSGRTFKLPEVDSSFTMFADSLTEGGFCRMVMTSKIERIEQKKNDVVRITTENSTYDIRFIRKE
jgi:hypothetical protein